MPRSSNKNRDRDARGDQKSVDLDGSGTGNANAQGESGTAADRPLLVFVVEDDEWYNRLLCHNLRLNPSNEVDAFFNGTDLLAALDRRPDVVTLDYRLPDQKGLELLNAIKASDSGIEVIVISEQDDVATAVELLQAGAFDYLVKTPDIRDRLLHDVERIRVQTGMKRRIHALEKEVKRKYAFREGIIGRSPAIEKVFGRMEKALGTDITVMISGETGTGKEVVAKAIHYHSRRSNGPFVAVNMAAIPAELVESELFGHEAGSFTGATGRRIGKFEEAHGGTLFLDEIAEMPLALQAKLLRALQEREIVRVGGNRPVLTDCRIMVATHRDLNASMRTGEFREDLYYRLYGLPIELPPLRDRGDDALMLADQFLREFCRANELPERTLDEQAKRKLLAYAWPGNVRELRSVVELAAVLASGDVIGADDLSLGGEDALARIAHENQSMRAYQRRIVQLYMQRCNDDTAEVARRLDIGQTTVYRLLKEDREAAEGADR